MVRETIDDMTYTVKMIRFIATPGIQEQTETGIMTW
jgi:hypothetical protein